MQACPASQQKLAKVCRNGAMSSLIAKHPDPSPALVVTSALNSMSLPIVIDVVSYIAAAVMPSKHSCFSCAVLRCA